MPIDDEPRSPAQVALAVLNQLRGQWDGLAFNAQVAVADVLARFWKAIAPRQYSFEPPVKWDSAVDAFLSDLNTRQDMPPPVQSSLAAPRQASPVTGVEGEALREAVSSFPGPGLPSFPPRSFSQPRQALLAAVRDLAIYWPTLDPDEQGQIDAAQTRLNDVVRGGASAEAQDAAIVEFLRSLDGLPAASVLFKRTLDEYTKPYAKASEYVRTLGSPYRDGFARPTPQVVSSHDAPVAKGLGSTRTPLAQPDELVGNVVRLHTRVDFPAEVALVAPVVPLVIQLTIQEPTPSPLNAIRQLLVEFSDPAKPIPLMVVVGAEGFTEITGDVSRTILAYSDKDSQPAVFLLKPTSPGSKRIVISFYCGDRSVGATDFETVVRDQERVDQLSRATINNPAVIEGLSPASQPPADLELRITLSKDQRQISFVLHSPKPEVNYHWKPAGVVELAANPQTLLRSNLDRLSQIAKRSRPEDDAGQRSQYAREIGEIGQNLYEQLFPDELKREYLRMRILQKQGKIARLLITSDEPWIPWEMIKPYGVVTRMDESGEQVDEDFDDPFLCDQFQISRWLAGRGVPDALVIASAQFVAFADNLEFVEAERKYFESLANSSLVGGRVVFNPTVDTADEVVSRLAQAQAQLYHFACHASFNADNPDESVLRLKGSPLRPSSIVGKTEAGVRKSKPLVFLNACHSGVAGFTFTGLGGWAQRLVGSGASAFIGSSWEVNDALAAAFAQRFYDALWSGKTLGEAAALARQAIRGDGSNPTWLAYVLYGDPSGTWTAAK